ncbi:LysR family transcriptional regulator [Desulforamulus hydrothermalis]|uniref:Regulatory protein LysR n=1 Tax=Desulforamulus hydrothermalis Lam5 = DSM 18033 TaxID=1121428 RepID=K8EHL3_9FIRM|nr:LysR family transcriptional regulator [Desulforamulus hydrothermalis]CCO08126.1 Regulatory protein LysR [Desulforamulus hydrothermalis Lam5 = DSM 18033]SHG81425.1 DNA-binding transcriptional regulator, LysR family [Desulforamulus hydrothermalis Lam5 = DSM 18033]
MRLEQLYYLVEIYRSKTISLAAERAHISQPALSAAISKLEDELGVNILKRTNQGVYPTEIGELIIQKAQEIIESIEDIKQIAKRNSLELNGNISMAVEPGVNLTIMPEVLTNFKYNHPKVNIFVKVGESNNILRDVQSGKADFGVILKTDELMQAKDINLRELFVDELVLIAGKQSPISRQGSITLAEALAQPVVLYNTEYVTNCGISGILKRHGDFNVLFRVDNLEMLEKILLHRECVSFIPKFMAEEYGKFSEIAIIPISDVPLDITIVIIWSSRHHLSMVEKELIKGIKSTCCDV